MLAQHQRYGSQELVEEWRPGKRKAVRIVQIGVKPKGIGKVVDCIQDPAQVIVFIKANWEQAILC
jgi:hypothetical protein